MQSPSSTNHNKVNLSRFVHYSAKAQQKKDPFLNLSALADCKALQHAPRMTPSQPQTR